MKVRRIEQGYNNIIALHLEMMGTSMLNIDHVAI